MASWGDFVVQAAATLLGVMWGIPIALWLNKQYSLFKKSEERRILINFLSENLKDNLRLIEDMALPFTGNNVVFFNLNLGAWSLFSQKIYLIDDLDLQRKILSIYYKLEHFSRKVDRQFEMHYSSFRAMRNYGEERAALVQSILLQISPIKEEINEILKQLSTLK